MYILISSCRQNHKYKTHKVRNLIVFFNCITKHFVLGKQYFQLSFCINKYRQLKIVITETI